MIIEVNEKFIDELRHTASKLRQAQHTIQERLFFEPRNDISNDIRSGYTLLESIVDSAEKGLDAHGSLIKREGHTHVVLKCFCLSRGHFVTPKKLFSTWASLFG